MTPPATLKIACPKCGYHANDSTWRGPVYNPGTRARQTIEEHLVYTCEGCGFKTTTPCLDVKP